MSDAARFGNRPALRSLGVTLTAPPEGHVILLLTRAGAAAPALDGLRPAGPGQWLLVGDAPLGPDDLAALSDRLPDVAILDQSHGRARIAVEGAAAVATLAKGTAVDLDALPVGASVTTMIGPIGAHLTRVEATRFELLVLRGFAEALWHDLSAMAAEYS